VTLQIFVLTPVTYCVHQNCMILPNDLGLHRKTGPYSLQELESALMAELVGEESIKIITSRYPFDVELLEQTGFEQRGGIEGNYNPLEQVLINTIHGQRGRISLLNDDWATGLIEFMVK